MRDYEEFPEASDLNSLFYIGAPQNLTEESLKVLHNLNLANKKFFSLEKLIKGKEKALVIYGSRDLVTALPGLNLVELEDYASDASGILSDRDQQKMVNMNQVLSWLVAPKNNPQKALLVTDELKGLIVEEDQKVFLQIVLMPIGKSGENNFQSTIRVMVADNDPIKRIELAKRTERTINASTGLNKYEDNFPEGKRFDSYKLRTLIPKEVSEFYLSSAEVMSLLKA